MTSSALYAAAGYIEAVWREIDHLVLDLPRALQPHGLDLKYKTFCKNEEDYSEIRVGFFYALRSAFARQRRSSGLVLYVDLHRPAGVDGWKHGEAPLLIVAYARDEDGWEVEQLAFDTAGRFQEPDARANLRPEPNSERRLLVWDGLHTPETPLNKCDWLFGVPLEQLNGPDDIERELLTPLVGLLKAGLNPNEAFAEARTTIIWPVVESRP